LAVVALTIFASVAHGQTAGAAPKALMRRGWDTWVKVPHAEAYRYHAAALQNIATTYTGDDGKRRLR